MSSIISSIAQSSSSSLPLSKEDLHGELVRNLSALKSWRCSVLIEGQSLGSTKQMLMNICDLLNVQNPLHVYPNGGVFQFPHDEFIGNSEQTIQRLKNVILAACKKAGFIISTTDSSKTKSRGKRLAMLDFKCTHGIAKRTTSNKQSLTQTRSRISFSASSEHLCPFGFKVFCDKTDSKWYIMQKQAASSCHPPSTHIGHFWISEDNIRSSLSEADEQTMKLMMYSDKCDMPAALVQRLISCSSEGTKNFTRNQICHLLSRMKTQEEMKKLSDSPNKSSAEKILASFERIKLDIDSNFLYIALIHSAEDGYKLKYPKGRPPKKLDAIRNLNIDEIRKCMQINDNQEVLLSIAWVSGEERNMVQKFPEIMTFDVTEKTNIEKRGLFLGVGQDGNGKIFTNLHCFMPNAQASSFNWIYREAIPYLWGTDAVRFNQVIITDGEEALYLPLTNIQESNQGWHGSKIKRYVIM